MVRKLKLKEDFEDEVYFDGLEAPTEETLDNLRNDLYRAVGDVMFKYRDFDLSKETLYDIIRRNTDRFYDSDMI